ncbi:hypothetical protein M0813_24439 [Anaeramoeba flamelloides]|uniref:Uncharacterized protein n=1 Tax=Anaeramoeba flamelloides TaxID=1746091 RepID=A0ABQ8Y670_9EUKA|nr:hypothetical protein M0813_24439 [Anaeramoeba flamelloides]
MSQLTEFFVFYGSFTCDQIVKSFQNEDIDLIGSTINFYIPEKDLSLRNQQLTTRQIWGNSPYHPKSDVVAMLTHSGSFVPTKSKCSKLGVIATVRFCDLPKSTTLALHNQNGVRPRFTLDKSIPQIEVTNCESVTSREQLKFMTKSLKQAHDLLFESIKMKKINNNTNTNTNRSIGINNNNQQTNNTSMDMKIETNEQDQKESVQENNLNTGNEIIIEKERQQQPTNLNGNTQNSNQPIKRKTPRKMQYPKKSSKNSNIYLQSLQNIYFSLSNDPCVAYSIETFCDFGLNNHERIKNRLQSEVIYFETLAERYELYLKSENNFRLSKVISPQLYDKSRMQSEQIIPMKEGTIQIILDDFTWSELIFSFENIVCKDKTFYPKKIFFLQKSNF